MKDSTQIYLLASEQDLAWGMAVDTLGYQSIGQNKPYPHSANHPSHYLFSEQRGRVLDEYVLIYISRGRGYFRSDKCKEVEIRPGTFFLLFSDEWHSYRPYKKDGWDEYWIGFRGESIERCIQKGFFRKDKPVFDVGVKDEIVQLYRQAISVAGEQGFGFQQILGGIVNHLLGLAFSLDKKNEMESMQASDQINQAKIIMRNTYTSDISCKEIAKQVNMSYSWFREIFKKHTGFAPLQYVLELRLQKSRELLANTDRTVKEVSLSSGFDNTDYFCTLFRSRMNMTPTQYRKQVRGENHVLRHEK